jgi:hypothetical protein
MLAAPPDVACIYFPRKDLYQTADEASRALRAVALARMERGDYDPRLLAYECHGHYHLGRVRTDRRA